jgi:hypothetical protein
LKPFFGNLCIQDVAQGFDTSRFHHMDRAAPELHDGVSRVFVVVSPLFFDMCDSGVVRCVVMVYRLGDDVQSVRFPA